MAVTRPDARKYVDVWVGTSLGILKGVSLDTVTNETTVTSYHKSMETADRSQEVCAMCWEHGAEGEMLYCGLKNGLVQRFNCHERVFEAECDCTGGKGVFVGLGKHEEVMITCTERGDLCFWPPDSEKTHCSVGNNLSCMTVSPDCMLQVATGGKENELKVWDGNKPDTPVFQAKNVKNDKFDLRVPVWVTAIGYVSGSGTQPTIAVATGYHQVRLYDTRVQRRPVYCQDFGEHPFNALSVTEDGQYIVVGNSIGEISRCDLRTGRIKSRYKGCSGGIKCVQCYNDGSRSLLASCSLDRYLRVYTLEPPNLIYKVYLKLVPSWLLFSKSSIDSNVEQLRNVKPVFTETDSEEDGSDDDVWKEMETVGSKSHPKKGNLHL